MVYDRNKHDKAEYMGQENVKEDKRASGRTSSMENTNWSGIAEFYKDLDTAADIEKKRFEWLGHLVRMANGRIVKKIFESKQEGRRRVGRPRLMWLEDVEKDVREITVKRWRQKAGNREWWASVINEAKAVRGP